MMIEFLKNLIQIQMIMIMTMTKYKYKLMMVWKMMFDNNKIELIINQFYYNL